jgi:hypothetical protein
MELIWDGISWPTVVLETSELQVPAPQLCENVMVLAKFTHLGVNICACTGFK